MVLNMHSGNGHKLHRHRTHLSAFTLIELAISILIFSVVAGVATLAVGRAQLAMASGKLERETRAAVSSLLSQVSTNPYTLLSSGTFERPSPCEQDLFKSCVTALGRNVEVTWVVTAGFDSLGFSAENPSSLEVSAAAELPSGTIIRLARTVVSPSGGSRGGALRIRLGGFSYDGPVFLVDSSGAIVASAVSDGTEAVLRGDPAQCNIPAPCRLALSADGSTRNGDVTLDSGAVFGARSRVVLSESSVLETAAVIVPVAEVNVLLEAWSPSGRNARARDLASVCFWFSFEANGQVEHVPACNDEVADRVVLRTYKPNPADPSLEVAIPQNTRIMVSVDHPNGGCPAIPGALAQSADGSGWLSNISVCTSRTWGSPALWGAVGGTLRPFDDATFSLSSSAPQFFNAVWAADDDRSLTFSPSNKPGLVLLPRGGSVFETAAPAASVEVWFTPVTTGVRQVLYEEGGADNGINLYLFNNRIFAGAWSASWSTPLMADAPVPPGGLQYAALVLDATADTLELYLNGALVANATEEGGGPLGVRADRSAIGGVAGTTLFPDTGLAVSAPTPFEGRIGQVVRHVRALPAAEIAEHHHARTEGPHQLHVLEMSRRPAALYQFEELDGVILYDASGNGLHAAVSGPGVNLLEVGENNLWGLWRFESDANNSISDFSGNGRHLTAGATTEVVSNGKAGGALDLDGVASSSPRSTAAAPTSSQVTLECWVYTTAATRGPCIRVGDGDNGYSVGLGQGSYQTSGLSAIGHIGGSSWLVGSASVSINSWNHLALVINGQTATLYVNGAESGVFTSLTVTPPSTGLHIGSNVGPSVAAGVTLSALVDEVALHTGALSVSEVLLRASDSPMLDAPGTNAGYPATGYSGQEPWSYPRSAEPCAETAMCEPEAAAPEVSACPGQHCNSTANAPPLLLSPRRGTYQVPGVVVGAGAAAFQVEVVDPDGESVTVTIPPDGLPDPAHGIVSLGGVPLVEQQVILEAAPGPAILPTLVFTPSAGWTNAALTLNLSDGTNATQSTVFFSPSFGGTYPAELRAGPVQVRQGGIDVADTFTIGDDGEPLGGVELTTGSLPDGASQQPSISGSAGWLFRFYDGGAAAAGVHTTLIQSGPQAVPSRFEVLSSAGEVNLSVPDLPQGAGADMLVSVRDGAGNQAVGIGVWFNVYNADGSPAAGVYPDIRGCVTDENGRCEVSMLAEAAAPSAGYFVTGVSGNASGSTSFVVNQSAQRIVVSGITVEQSGSAGAVATVYDGSGEPMRGVILGALGSPAGITVTSSGPTDSTGRTTFTIRVADDVPPGVVTLSIADGNFAEVSLRLTVRSAVVQITAQPLTVAQGGTASWELTALNPQGSPVEAATLEIGGSGAVIATSRVVTDGAGRALVSLRVPLNVGTGSYKLPVSYNGQVIRTLDLTVTTGVSSVVATGSFIRGEPGTVTLRLRDQGNLPVASRALEVAVDYRFAEPAARELVSDNEGAAQASFTFNTSVAPGLYTLRVNVDGRVILVGVVVQ